MAPIRMSSERESRSKEYSQAKEAFKSLGVEERTFFLVESAVATVLDGLKKASDTLSDVMSEAFEGASEAAEEGSTSSKTGTSSGAKKKSGAKSAAGKAGKAPPGGGNPAGTGQSGQSDTNSGNVS